MSESVRSAFSLLLDLYHMDCEQFCDTEKPLFFSLLQQIIKLPWEAKAKHHRLAALLPYLGTDTVGVTGDSTTTATSYKQLHKVWR